MDTEMLSIVLLCSVFNLIISRFCNPGTTRRSIPDIFPNQRLSNIVSCCPVFNFIVLWDQSTSIPSPPSKKKSKICSKMVLNTLRSVWLFVQAFVKVNELNCVFLCVYMCRLTCCPLPTLCYSSSTNPDNIHAMNFLSFIVRNWINLIQQILLWLYF